MNLGIHQKANNLVRNEIFSNLSALVEAMASKGDEEAQELTYGVLDYGSAAEEAGWAYEGGVWRNYQCDDAREIHYEDAQELCEDQGIDPHEREVFEHYSVSVWLAIELEKRGEKVARDWYGHSVWARTNTGQSISIDGVIEDIVRAMARG
jgi:hypothetical protein